MCVALAAALALSSPADARLAPPTLVLHADRTLTVQWEEDEPELAHRLLLTVTRPGASSTHVTKLALAGSRELRWGAMPQHARCCFRVVAVKGDADEEGYSDENCVASSGCEEPPPSAHVFFVFTPVCSQP